MSGSKKGEHRGAAKRAAKKAAGTKPKYGVKPFGPNKITREIENEIARILNPGDLAYLMPKEQMLIAMREHMAEFAEWKAMQQAEMATSPITTDTIRRAAFASAKAREALILATDASYKAAPFLHPRLAALAMVPNDNDNPRGIVQAMLDEIDQRSRSAKMIEHRANDSVIENDEDVA